MILTKEEVIILRTIFLEFGDEHHWQRRTELPYENLVTEIPEEYKHKWYLAPYYSTFYKSLEGFSNPAVSDSVFSYFLLDGNDMDKIKVIKGNIKMVSWEDKDGQDWRDNSIFLKPYSQSDLFLNLRMGLYYKGLCKPDLAITHLLASRMAYFEKLKGFVRETEEWLTNVYAITGKYSGPYTLEGVLNELVRKGVPISRPEPPVELFLEIEEMPSFHLAEIYLQEADEHLRQDHIEDARNNFVKAINYLQESEKCYSTIFYKHNELREVIDLQPLLDSNLLNFPEAPFKRDPYLEDNLSHGLEGLRQTSGPETEEEWEHVKNNLLDIAARAELELRVKGLQEKINKMETYKELVENAPVPLLNELKLYRIFQQSKQRIWWIDKHFSYKGLNYLKDSNLAGKVLEIRILTGKDTTIDDRFKENFLRFKTMVGQKNTMVLMRVIKDDGLLKSIHDRFIICDDNAYNVPPVGSIAARQYAEINATDRMPPFADWWEYGTDI